MDTISSVFVHFYVTVTVLAAALTAATAIIIFIPIRWMRIVEIFNFFILRGSIKEAENMTS